MKRLTLERSCAWIGIVALGLVLAAAPSRSAERPTDAAVFHKAVPSGTADLHAIEQAADKVAGVALACTVGVQVGPAQGSGVIVSQDGYVVTAGHVVGRPGRTVNVRLPDGRTVHGKSLGIHTSADTALIKISEPGPWPFAPLVTAAEAPKVGDWCLVAGHPGGFQEDRAAPVRVGRVLDVTADVLRTDCPITGGDSGGPVFDMNGRVIGIHSRISTDLTENLHGPALACVKAWDELKAGKIYPAVPPSRFLDRFDVNRDGKITRSEQPDGLSARVFDRLVSKFMLDPNASYTVEELTKAIGWTPAPAIPGFGKPYIAETHAKESLPETQFVRGSSVRHAFREVVREAAKSTVAIESEGRQVALGTVVDAEGEVLTKASELTESVTCKLDDGRRYTARVLALDPHYDLALLRIDSSGLTPVQWASSAELRPGHWLITPDAVDGVASVGVVSVSAREIPGLAVLGVQTDASTARIEEVFPESGAAKAGIQVGDTLTRVADRTVGNVRDVRVAVQGLHPGDVVKVTFTRGEESHEVEVTLRAASEVFASESSRLDGPLSRRRDCFPTAIENDAVLDPTECGGPVVDDDGKVVGVNIARADRVTSHALPGEVVREVVKELKEQAAAATGGKS